MKDKLVRALVIAFKAVAKPFLIAFLGALGGQAMAPDLLKQLLGLLGQ